MSLALPPQCRALGFIRNPFPQTPDADCYFRTDQNERQFAEMMHCVRAGKGFMLLTGDVGTGKSTFLRRMIDRLNGDGCVTAYVFNTFLQGRDLLLAINRDFGLAAGADLTDDLARLNHFLIDANDRGQSCVVLIDDAQNFDAATLELVRLLSNLETRQHKLLQIVLAGQPELAALLSRPSIRQLASRIVQHAHLTPLSAQECGRYVDFRIGQCLGAGGPVTLTEAARRALYAYCSGNPRWIHLIMDRCLYGVITRSDRRIEAMLIHAAAREAGMATAARGPGGRGRRFWHGAAALVGIAAIGMGVAARKLAKTPAAAPVTATAAQAPHGESTTGAPATLHDCLAALGAARWLPVLEHGLTAETAALLDQSLAQQKLALTSAQEARPAGRHCSWTTASGTWLLTSLTHAPFPVQTGAREDAIRWLQQRLAAAGTYTEPVDGIPGPRTRAALAEFRARRGLAFAPALNPVTMTMLEISAPAVPAANAATDAIRTVK